MSLNQYNASLLLLLIMISTNSCTDKKYMDVGEAPMTAKIYGDIVNYSEDTLFLKNYTAESMYMENERFVIPLGKQTSFELEIQLKEPAYYKLGHNFLYLSPNDSLKIKLDYKQGRSSAKFEGRGYEANNYLSQIPYAKSGSFWGNSNISDQINTFEEAETVFKNLVDQRTQQLESLSNTTDAFKALERARIRFHYANSLLKSHYLLYAKYKRGEIAEEEMSGNKLRSFMEEASSHYKSEIKASLSDFNNINLLQLEVFQSLLFAIADDTFRRKYELPPLNNELKDY